MFISNIFEDFKKRFGTIPRIFSSPGRINLIGEHTDYNDGFVLPAAVDYYIAMAIHPNSINFFRFYSYDYSEYFELEISDIKKSETHWANYLLGIIDQFNRNGKYITGVDCVFGGNIPIGAGLSSSAAIECGFAFGLNEIFQTGFKKIDLVKMAQLAEHEFAGVMCGIMDQFTSVLGKENKVILLDCRSLDYKYFSLNIPDYDIVLCDTMVKHSLASSEYNKRRLECEEGVKLIQQYENGVHSLRDVDINMINKYKLQFNPVIFRRCKYIVEENIRVINSCLALENNRPELLGENMFASHSGLKNDYEVSCNELDILVDFAKKQDCVIGARMMGGGFGGCTINLVRKLKTESFIKRITREYLDSTNKKLGVYKTRISGGTSEIILTD